MEHDDCELVQTCGVCEQICNQKDIAEHSCLEGYSSYAVDPNTLYFYPLADDGTTIVRRSNINNVEQLVDEPFYDNCGNNIVHISQKGKRKVSGQVKQISNKRSKLNDSAGNKLNFDDVEFLILEVQKRPPLWDYSLPLLQRKSTIKQRLWSEIALALNGKISAEETQKKFKSLHDTFRKIIQSEQRMNGSVRKDTIQKWPHYHSMSFLKDSCLQKITVSNINNDDSNLSLMDDEDNAESIRTENMFFLYSRFQ
ncbi:uncharacterized protein [Temnothorax nylanderi]|uniref:uncharacterized protein isoform X2 n=1 Tax=Temnothorax nylanderi TaxID=102681 RepID=UPI003A8BB7FE